jgi:hypothetical protein
MALNDALRVEQWAGRVFTEYQLTRVYEPQMMLHFEGGIGERINFPVIERQVDGSADPRPACARAGPR